jgi:hypothetical protein
MSATPVMATMKSTIMRQPLSGGDTCKELDRGTELLGPLLAVVPESVDGTDPWLAVSRRGLRRTVAGAAGDWAAVCVCASRGRRRRHRPHHCTGRGSSRPTPAAIRTPRRRTPGRGTARPPSIAPTHSPRFASYAGTATGPPVQAGNPIPSIDPMVAAATDSTGLTVCSDPLTFPRPRGVRIASKTNASLLLMLEASVWAAIQDTVQEEGIGPGQRTA